MSVQKIVILDGTRSEDKGLDAILLLLLEVLYQNKNNTVNVEKFTLREIKMHHCIGCFNCWLKTPGKCIHRDAGIQILEAILHCDVIVLFTPVVFGGYSSELKKIIDRFLPLALPFFSKVNGETHHPPRYLKFPRIVGIGVHSSPAQKLSKCFKTLIGRNAVNFAQSPYSVDVLNSSSDSETLRSQLTDLLARREELPWSEELDTLAGNLIATTPHILTSAQRVLLITGSPKIKSPSTSKVLGESLLKKLQKHGCNTSSLTLTSKLLSETSRSVLCSAVDKAETLLISFPLYVDTLPFLVTKAFEIISQHRRTTKTARPQRLVVLVNNGYPEAHHNTVALEICRLFAQECGIRWSGGVALGAGEVLLSGKPITGFRGLKGLWRPPLYYLDQALNLIAAALADGYPVPVKAAQLIARKPIPLISINLWHWMYINVGKKIWENEAVKNGISKQAMFGMPYLKDK
ncbi:MAG: flavodoxin family protein [Candidatus Electrothrix scaldis]|nr:MAG: flavodoxin family protein [Candidatus Electrothrix sp. GW3-3]